MNAAATARRAIGLLDLTELGEAAGETEIRSLCRRAVGGGAVPPVAAVCVWMRHVALARSLLPGTIRVATVINFPDGASAPSTVLAEAAEAVSQGADDVDLVMPYRAFLAGDHALPADMIAAVRKALPGAVRLKVILETSLYPDAVHIRDAADLAIAAGADFIKTSTGKVAGGASLEAARVMLEAIRASGRPVGLKPSGGIRTLADAAGYLALADGIMGSGWVAPATFRFGASGLHAALAGELTNDGPPPPGTGY